MSAQIYTIQIKPFDPDCARDVLAAHTGLPKVRIKKAMQQGAAWLKRSGGKKRRVRRATAHVKPGDVLFLYYNETIIQKQPPTAYCIKDFNGYSIWYKPAGLMSQGSVFGDHLCLARQVETYFDPARKAYIVHRIDREASGLLIVAHNRSAAAAFSELLRSGRIEKYYHVRVRGDLSHYAGKSGIIDLPIDNRSACSRFDFLGYDRRSGQSVARVRTETGRRHQIRRHFNLIGHPVMGDPVYGKGNKNASGLMLIAYALKFTCPLEDRPISIEIDPDNRQ
jgi:tRNA pseudouridine32 synthase/23S rRNA pseudouridine746 synthase